MCVWSSGYTSNPRSTACSEHEMWQTVATRVRQQGWPECLPVPCPSCRLCPGKDARIGSALGGRNSITQCRKSEVWQLSLAQHHSRGARMITHLRCSSETLPLPYVNLCLMLKGIIKNRDLVLLPALALRRELCHHASCSPLHDPCSDLQCWSPEDHHGLRRLGPRHLHSPPTAMPHAGWLSGPLNLRRQ